MGSGDSSYSRLPSELLDLSGILDTKFSNHEDNMDNKIVTIVFKDVVNTASFSRDDNSYADITDAYAVIDWEMLSKNNIDYVEAVYMSKVQVTTGDCRALDMSDNVLFHDQFGNSDWKANVAVESVSDYSGTDVLKFQLRGGGGSYTAYVRLINLYYLKNNRT